MANKRVDKILNFSRTNSSVRNSKKYSIQKIIEIIIIGRATYKNIA